MEFISLVGLAVGVFISTNIDDLFVLIGLMSDPSLRVAQVVGGQYLGMGLLAGVAVALSLVSFFIPRPWIGLMGILPILMGASRLAQVYTARADRSVSGTAHRVPGRFGKVAMVAAVTAANGGDNIGAYVPMFATRPFSETGLILGIFAVMTGLWCWAAFSLVHHLAIGAPIRRWGPVLLPFALIALGFYIFAAAGTFSLFGAAPR